MKTAKFVALMALGAAVIGAAPRLYQAKLDHPELPEVRITFDHLVARGEHKGVSVAAGLAASGSAINLPVGSSLWLMDRDASGYTIAEQAEVSRKTWNAQSFPVGDPGQTLPFTFRAAIVQATTACAGQLRMAVLKDKDFFPALPTGCAEIASLPVRVIER